MTGPDACPPGAPGPGTRGPRAGRVFPLLVAACYLARCARRGPDGRCRPPPDLGAATWQQAYDRFHRALDRDCPPHRFRRRMQAARVAFRVLLAAARCCGGASASGFLLVLQRWQGRPDGQLERHALAFLDEPLPAPGPDARPRPPGAPAPEGKPRAALASRPERNARLRAQAIALHGLDCAACGFNFEAFYGPPGERFIEVHHLYPFGQAGPRHTDPATDLTVLCANTRAARIRFRPMAANETTELAGRNSCHRTVGWMVPGGTPAPSLSVLRLPERKGEFPGCSTAHLRQAVTAESNGGRPPWMDVAPAPSATFSAPAAPAAPLPVHRPSAPRITPGGSFHAAAARAERGIGLGESPRPVSQASIASAGQQTARAPTLLGSANSPGRIVLWRVARESCKRSSTP